MAGEQTRFRVEIPTVIDPQLEAQVSDLLGRADVLRNASAGKGDARLSNAADRYENEARLLLETRAPAHFAMAHGSHPEILVEKITSRDGRVEAIKMSPIVTGNAGSRAIIHAETVPVANSQAIEDYAMLKAPEIARYSAPTEIEPVFGKDAGLLGMLGNVLTHALGIHGRETTIISADAVERTQSWLAESMRDQCVAREQMIVANRMASIDDPVQQHAIIAEVETKSEADRAFEQRVWEEGARALGYAQL
jgi:hypothetical protein